MKITKVLTLSLFLFLFSIDLNLVSSQRYYSITPKTFFWRSDPIFTLSSVRSPIICFNKIKSISGSANILVVENFVEQNQSYRSFRCNAYSLNSYFYSITIDSDNSTLYTYGTYLKLYFKLWQIILFFY